MKPQRLADVVRQIAADSGRPTTRFEVSALRRWFALPPMHALPRAESKLAWERVPLSSVLGRSAVPEMLPKLSAAERHGEGAAAEQPGRFRAVLKKYALCVHHAEEWGLDAEHLEPYLLALKAYLLAGPFVLGALDAEELTVLLLTQTDWRLLDRLDLLEAKKRFLALLPRMEFDQLVCCFEVLQREAAARAVPVDFSAAELLRLTDYIAAFEPSSPLDGAGALSAVARGLAEAKVDHRALFERLLAALAPPRPDTDALLPRFLFAVADLRLDLGEKALLDLFARALGARGLPELRRLLCALIIFKKVVFRRSPRFSLQYEYYLQHFLERYRAALGLRGAELCPRDGVIAAYCRHFLARSAGSAALAGCAAAVAELLAARQVTPGGYQSFSRGHISALRFMRALGLRVETEAATQLGAVDFHLPELGLHVEHSGAAHALHFRPQLWSGYYVLRCNLLKRELPRFFEVRDNDDLRRLLAQFLPRLSLRAGTRAGARARLQRCAFDRLYAAQPDEPLGLEDQLEFPIEEYARESAAQL